MKFLQTKKRIYEVAENPDGTVKITVGGKFFRNAGKLIEDCGGLENFKKRLVNREIQKRKKTDFCKIALESLKKAKETDYVSDWIAAAVAFSHCDWVMPEISEIFQNDNNFSRGLIAYGGSYTYNQYEREIVVKFDNGRRFSTSRRSSLRNCGKISDIFA